MARKPAAVGDIMGKKKKQKIDRSQNNKPQSNKKKQANKKKTVQSLDKIEIVKAPKKIIEGDLIFCPCYRKKYCILRDDYCIPYSLKCIRNKKSFSKPVMAAEPSYTRADKRSYSGSSTYNPLVDERYGNNKDIKVLNKNGEIVLLYVFKGFLNLKQEDTIDYYVMAKDIRSGRECRLTVAFNKRMERYYISDTQLKWLHKKDIYPNMIFNVCNEGSRPLITGDFQEFSKLALYGYSVGKNGMKAKDRHRILAHVLDNKIMYRYEIIEHLQGLIMLREMRSDKDFSAAINDWREDIIFINDYESKKS